MRRTRTGKAASMLDPETARVFGHIPQGLPFVSIGWIARCIEPLVLRHHLYRRRRLHDRRVGLGGRR